MPWGRSSRGCRLSSSWTHIINSVNSTTPLNPSVNVTDLLVWLSCRNYTSFLIRIYPRVSTLPSFRPTKTRNHFFVLLQNLLNIPPLYRGWKIPRLRYTMRITTQNKITYIFDDFGLRSPVIQIPFQPKTIIYYYLYHLSTRPGNLTETINWQKTVCHETAV